MGNQTSVRLDPGQKEQLEAIAKKNGVDPAQLIRWAIDELVKYAEKNGGRILLPIDFGEKLVIIGKEVVLGKEEAPAHMGSTVSSRGRGVSGADESTGLISEAPHAPRSGKGSAKR
ncbi:MAG TPA: CopG family transcriptional regulator [Chthoniobacteraceae bacterium]|jgi:hypothetical protein|nr:CopG family transcriptional regulator [Chthoniobacteraceae bacterium]